MKTKQRKNNDTNLVIGLRPVDVTGREYFLNDPELKQPY